MQDRQPINGFPEPPYYAVIFTSRRPINTDDDYDEVAERMFCLASEQPGFLGADSTRDAAGVGITVSYWTDEDSIRSWHELGERRVAQAAGYDRFYEEFSIRISKVERQYGFSRDSQ